MKDLLVSIPSRDRPGKLMNMINMVLDTCDNKDNFDLQIIIDTDQIVAYSGVIMTYPNLNYAFIPYGFGSWQNIFNAQHNKLFKDNYYFLWVLPDDMEGLHKGWDTEILSKKKAFTDDLFVLFTQGARFWGRIPETHRGCYTTADNRDLVDAHEPNPVLTYKWVEFMAPLFYPPSQYTGYRELMVAEIIRLLFIKYGINRNVESQVNYDFIKNNGTSAKIIKPWIDLQKRDYDDLLPIVEKMKKYINEYANWQS